MSKKIFPSDFEDKFTAPQMWHIKMQIEQHDFAIAYYYYSCWMVKCVVLS